MNILAVDTSAGFMTVALKKDTYYEEYNCADMAGQTNEILVPKINELCSASGISVRDIDLFLCTRGPGSFTGLRIGMATLKGMAYAGGKPLVSVPTMDVWVDTASYADGAVVVAIDARKKRFYLAAFEVRDSSIRRLSDDIDGDERDIADFLAPYDRVLVTGPDAAAFSGRLDVFFKGSKTVETRQVEDKTVGMSLIDVGLLRFADSGSDDIAQGPVYIRKSDAEEALFGK